MSALLDIALIVVLLAYLAAGYRRGFVHSIAAILGVVAGGIAAVLVVPMITPLVPDATLRVIAALVSSVVLLLLGHGIGAGIGAFIGRGVQRTPLGVIDRLLGAAVTVSIAALAASAISAGVLTMGVPALAQPIASSTVLRTIAALTPSPVSAAIAQLRSTVVTQGLPRIDQALGTAITPSTPPTVRTSSAALVAAAKSVVQVTGTAYACGQDQKGSGFVIARDRVLTNAHVVAGVTAPVVLARDGTATVGQVVSFDPKHDLAVIAVSGLKASALRIGGTPAAGTVGVIQGYPYGGPFTTTGARVESTGSAQVANVDGSGTSSRAIATLAADVEQGDSGGPLLSTSGQVLGIVFAKSSTTAEVGYAMLTSQFRALAERSPNLSTAVSSGDCQKG